MKMKQVLIFFAIFFSGLVLMNVSFAETQSATFTPEQAQQIKTIVHDYLLKNPQILVEVSKKLQQQQAAKQEVKARKAITDNAAALFGDQNTPTVGNTDGNVTLVEFFDYQCIHCKMVSPVIDKLIKANPNLRVVYKSLPIFGKVSQMAAVAAMASIKQGKYNEFHEALMAADKRLSAKVIMAIAKKAGLNTDELKKDMQSSVIKSELKQNFSLANALGIIGTPAFIIAKYNTKTNALEKNANGKSVFFVPGAAEQVYLQHRISEATGKAASKASDNS